MCGIAGIFSLSGRPIARAETRIRRMTDMLIHRGPDSQGIYVADSGLVALGNTRLAIVDPNCREPQPMISGDGGAVLSFNGEIYNHPEMRRHLGEKSVALRTHIDTEIVLEGIRRFGPGFLNKLDGMWAIAYHDIAEGSLMLSRDLMGERHIFYRVTGDELVFASEPGPIVADSPEALSIDYDAALSAIRFGGPPPGRSLVNGIRRMLPGHDLFARPGKGIEEKRRALLHPEKWFDFFNSEPSEKQIIERYEEILTRVCQNRVPTDVPYFSTLSGGIDSTLISLYASDFGKRKISTLFGQSTDKPAQKRPDELDEFAASKLTSTKIGSDHHHIHLDSNDSVAVLNRMAGDCFDGVMDTAPASFEMLAHKVRGEGAKVILISDGPDELVGGYTNDQRSFRMDRRKEQSPLRHGMLRAASASRVGRGLVRRLYGEELVASPFESASPFVFRPIHESFIPDYLEKLVPLDDLVRATSGHYGVEDEAYGHITRYLDPSQRRALSYAALSLPDMFNLRTDKAFLRASVESRLPWQAPEIVELMIATPTKWRFGNGDTTKLILRRIVEKHIGAAVSTRSKHGFSAHLWSRPNIYNQLGIDETLESCDLFSGGVFRKSAREKIFNGTPGYDAFKWALFTLAKTEESLKKAQQNRT
mgnify:CR=1 FL=1